LTERGTRREKVNLQYLFEKNIIANLEREGITLTPLQQRWLLLEVQKIARTAIDFAYGNYHYKDG